MFPVYNKLSELPMQSLNLLMLAKVFVPDYLIAIFQNCK